MATESSESPQQTIARLTAELAAAQTTIARFESAQKQKGEDEIKIAEKMAYGLTRDQAAAVLRRQRNHDHAENTKSTAKTNPLNSKLNTTVTATNQ
jgi:hypothetical protein